MSHFVVNIIVPNELLLDRKKLDKHIEIIMSRFDEGREVDPYPAWTRETAAEEKKKQIREYQSHLNDPNPPDHWLQPGGWLEICQNKIVSLNTKSDEEYFQELSERYEEFNENGEPLSTYNPESKWDWYRIGGRWDGWLTDKEEERSSDNGFNWGDDHTSLKFNCISVAEAIEKEKIPYALITPDGEWKEKGEMGWFGMSSGDKDGDVWTSQVILFYEMYKEGNSVISIDAHI